MYEIRFVNPITGLRQTKYFHHYPNLEDYVRKFRCPLTYEVKDDDEDNFEIKYYPGESYYDILDIVNNLYYEFCKLND